MRVWFIMAGGALLTWGIIRIKTGNQRDRRIGQDTINFVFALAAATVGLMALYHH